MKRRDFFSKAAVAMAGATAMPLTSAARDKRILLDDDRLGVVELERLAREACGDLWPPFDSSIGIRRTMISGKKMASFHRHMTGGKLDSYYKYLLPIIVVAYRETFFRELRREYELAIDLTLRRWQALLDANGQVDRQTAKFIRRSEEFAFRHAHRLSGLQMGTVR